MTDCPNCEYHRQRAQRWREEVYKQAGHPLPEREQEHDYKDLYEKEKRKSAMWLSKYEEVAGPAPKAIPMAQPEQEPVAWKYDVTYNQDGTVSVALPDGDELRIVLPNKQEPYCWSWDVWVSGGKWRAEYGWEKPTEKVVNLQPLYTTPPQRKPLTDKELNLIGAQWHYNLLGKDDKAELFAFARAIEAAHGIKGEA